MVFSSGCNIRKVYKYSLNMQDSKHRITNFFWPKSSKRLRILDFYSLETQAGQISFGGENDDDDLNTLHRIIDAFKKNSKCASIISTFFKAVESVPCVLDQVQEWQQKRRNIKGIYAADVLKFINVEYADFTDEMEWQEKDDDTTKQQLEIIHMWRWCKANINKIETRLQVPLSIARIAIKKYKLKAKAM